MVRFLRNQSEADFSNQFKNDTKCRNVLMNFDDGKDLGVITMREKLWNEYAKNWVTIRIGII